MKKLTRKLKINRETLSNMSASALPGVAGGASQRASCIIACFPATNYCPTAVTCNYHCSNVYCTAGC
ncbi:MAG: class I lanthipeptide [Acidobacteriota bacterium]|nr:class I lanthipeptide [Acidobacteriota bacterium]